MYIDPQEFNSSIMQYREEFSSFVEIEALIVDYWKEQFKEGYSVTLKHEDYYDEISQSGVTKVDIISSLSAGIIIRICGNFEFRLTLLCDVVQRALGIGIGHDLIKGSSIAKVLKYLDSLLDLDFKNKNKDICGKVNSWYAVRNILVHHNASSDMNEDFNHYFKVDVIFDHNINALVTDIDDCIRLITILNEFSNKLFDALINVVGGCEDPDEDMSLE